MAPRAPSVLTAALLFCLAWHRGLGHATNRGRGPSALGIGEEPDKREQLHVLNQLIHLVEGPHAAQGSDGRGEPPGAPLARASSAASSSSPGEPDLDGLLPRRVRRRSFEQCPANAGGASNFAGARAAKSKLAALAELRRVRSHRASATPESECENGTLIGGWGSDFQYTQTCCTNLGFCAGCAAIKGGKCSQCDAGYVLQSNGTCLMCDDVTDWKDENDKTCTDYETSGDCSSGQPPSVDEAFKGLKPSDACCICGGGQVNATPWHYHISEQVLVFGEKVSAMPSPQTAHRYEVSPGCTLGDLGLSLGGGGGLSGTLLEYKEGENSYAVDCKVTAVEDEVRGLSAVDTLRVSVQPMSYGPKVVVFRFFVGDTKPTGQATWPLTVAEGLRLQKFGVACIPAVPWISVDDKDGTLSYSGDGPPERSGGLSGEHSGFSSGECTLTAMQKDGDSKEVEARFVVLQLRVWENMAYERGVIARVGRPIVPLPLVQKPQEGYATRRDEDTGVEYWFNVQDTSEEEPVPKALRPTLLSVECEGANHTRWSRQTGEVTIEGQLAFVIDPATGQISGTPQVDLPQRLGRAHLMLLCHIAAGGKNYESLLTTTLYVQLVDDTCWYQRSVSEPVWATELNITSGKDKAGSCKTECRKLSDCAAYWVKETDGVSKCFGLTSMLAQDGARTAQVYQPDTIAVRAKCEEGKTCLEVQSETAGFLEGNFCPKGIFEEEDFDVRTIGTESVFAKKGAATDSDFIMFSKQDTHKRFADLHKDNSEHFVAVKYKDGKWYLNSDGMLYFFEPVETDVLVATADLSKSKATTWEGERDTYNGVVKGYWDGDLSIKASGCDKSAAFCITGKWWRPWELYDQVTTTLYSRSGVTAEEEYWMARGSCPLSGQTGEWVIRKANKQDYMNPDTGVSELRGDVIACITEDIEENVFALGKWTSKVSIPVETETDDTMETYMEDAEITETDYEITVSLTSLSCQQPTASTGMLFGSVSSPESYSLHACECFGWEYKDDEPVTEEGRGIVPVTAKDYNSFTPDSQLIFDGPYVCEDDAVLPFGQKNEIQEDECLQNCLGTDGCAFYMYVKQLRFCLLLSKCEQLGHTGLDTTHSLYGVFKDESSKYCRIADPEACWLSRKRRALLDTGLTKFSSCAFEDVISMCDTMQMANTEAHGECKRCEYVPIKSEAAKGRSKVPLPTSFLGGSQIVASCDTSYVGARLRNNLLRQGDKAFLTCVDGTWHGADDFEGLEHLSCISCLQVAQQSYTESSHPEIYFLSKRELRYHFGYGKRGCLAASEATSSPLVNSRKSWCMKFYGSSVSAGDDCSQSWYLSQRGELLVAGLMPVCLRSTKAGGLEVTARCDEGDDHEERRSWSMDPQYHLINLYSNKCLQQSQKDGSLELSACDYETSAQVWFFDGGDCQYQMYLHSQAQPLLWNFKVTGDTYLGNQEDYGELTDLAEAQEGIDPLAFGTCKTSLTASLKNPDLEVFEQFDLNHSTDNSTNDYTERLADKFNHAFAFSAGGDIVSACPFGGQSGIKSAARFAQERADKEAQIYALETTCDYAKKTSDPDPKDFDLTDTEEKVYEVAPKTNQVLSGVWSTHSNWYEDRSWKIAFATVSGVTISSDGEGSWSEWSAYTEEASQECPDNYVLTGIHSVHTDSSQDRRFKIQCREVTGHYKDLTVKSEWTAYKNELDAEFEYRSDKDQFVIGIKSTFTSGNDDRRFKFRTVKLCKSKTSEVDALKEEIAALDAKIANISDDEVTCTTDFPMHIETVRELEVGYSNASLHVPIVKASSRCHLMHRGHPGSAGGFALSASQLASMVRAEVYRGVPAQSCREAPFRYNGSDGDAAPAEAMKVGCFAMVENGAALWGIRCKPGAVVAVDSSSGSPYCLQVNAAIGDVVLGALMPNSASCELGYAAGGWYSLQGSSVVARGSGGPSDPTGFRLTCRAVPGLSRLCEIKEGRCEANEVVAGIAYEKGTGIKYKCCLSPQTVGQHFVQSRLLEMKPWEGYYCPAGFDGTGRAIYEMSRSLATTESTKSSSSVQTDNSWWPDVHRSTPPGSVGNGAFWQLAEHGARCDPGELMTSWTIRRKASASVSAAFSCVRLGFSSGSSLAGLQPDGCQELRTEYKSGNDHKAAGGQDIGLLLGHHVDCPNGTALASWRIANDTGKQKYVFVCCAVHTREDGEGHEYFSMPVEDNASLTQIAIMSRHNVACPRGNVIRSFQMERVKTSYFRYRLQCIGVRTERHVKGESHRLAWNKFWRTWVLLQIPVVESRTGADPIGPDAEPYYLHCRQVECSHGFAMQGLSFENLYGYSHKSVGELQSKDFDYSNTAEEGFDGHHAVVAYCRATKLGTCTEHSTKKQKLTNKGTITDLSKHEIECPKDEALRQFKVQVTGTRSYELSFVYTCCKVPDLSTDTCQDLKTGTTSASGNVMALADIDVKCQEGKVLQQLHLQSDGAAQIYWSYICCAAAGVLHSDGGIRSSAAQPEDEVAGDDPGAQRAKVFSPSSDTSSKKAKFWLDDKLEPDTENTSKIYVLALDGASRKHLSSCWETDVNFGGHDLSSATGIGSAAACQRSCRDASGCAGFTYSSDKQTCSLKTSDAGRTTDKGLVSGPKQCYLRSFGSDGEGWVSATTAHLNSLAKGSVVILSMTGTSGEQFTGPLFHAFQRCGARKLGVGNHSWEARDAYALVGVVGEEAVDEAFSETPGSSVTLDVELPDPWTAAPLVELDAAFMSSGGTKSGQPKEKPVKPELVSFSTTQPDYDKFCNVAARQSLMGCEDGHQCPEEQHPCYHTYANKVTEQAWWKCAQRDENRKYVRNMFEAQQRESLAEWAKAEYYFSFVESGISIAATAIAAIPWGGYGTAAKETTSAASKKASGAVKKKIFKAIAEAFKKKAAKVGEALSATTKDVLKTIGKEIGKKAAKHAETEIMYKEKVSLMDGVKFETGDDDFKGLGLISPDGDEVDAIPDMEAPDRFGFAGARNAVKYAKARWADCHPLQQGLSKVMCDLYCTENAVKEGNAAVIKNIKKSNDVLMTNIEKLLDYHTQTLLWGMSQLKTKNSASSSLLLWRGGDDDKRRLPTEAGGAAAGLGLGQVQAALKELKALPRLLETDGMALEDGPRGSPPGGAALAHDVVDWHSEASHKMLGRLDDVLERAANATGGVPGAVQQATALVKRFASERALRLGKPAPQRHEVLQSMTSKKAVALREQLQGRAQTLEQVSGQSSPMRGASPEVLLDLVDDDVIIRWNQLADHFVAAHEKHAVFAQARTRALAAAEDAIHNAENYVGCGGSQLGDLQDSWQHALRVEDHAADVLLEAWASTVGAQERLQMAVDAGLLPRIAGVAAIRAAEGGGCRGEVALVAEEAHAAGVRAVDRALWPLLEQVVVLEQIAKYQQDEIRAKKLRGVDRVPVTPTLQALHRLAADGADPATPAGRALAARALDRLGPAACPAPGGCGVGMLLFNSTEGLAWTAQRPGSLLSQTEGTPAAALVRACAPPGDLCADPGGQPPESLLQPQQEQQQHQQQQLYEPQPQQACGPGCEERLRLTLSKKKSTIQKATELLFRPQAPELLH